MRFLSVVTSVSVIMDHGNGTKTYLTDGEVGDKKPQVVGTPGTLLAPDRYEFYSFGEDGELVKKLMTLDQIQSLIAGGEDLEPLPIYYPQPLIDNGHTEGVHKVLESVQNVLKGELQNAKLTNKVPIPLPDDSWSIFLPGLLNSDLDFKDTHIPIRSEPSSTTRLPTTVSELPSTRTPSPSTVSQRSTTPTPLTSPKQTTVQTTWASTTKPTERTSTTTRKTSTKSTTYRTTAIPQIRTTTRQPVKPQNYKPGPTKRPYVSTKKPYISDSPYSKIPLSTLNHGESTTKITTTTVKKPVNIEERNPSTNPPEIKHPTTEKQKPSGIPTIIHYLPINSVSPPNSTSKGTTPSYQETSTQKYNKLSPIASVTTTKITSTARPSTVSQAPSTTKTYSTTTRKPIQKVPVYQYVKVTQTPHKTTQKPPSTLSQTTKQPNKVTTYTATVPTTTTEASKLSSSFTNISTKKPEVSLGTTTKPNALPNPEKLVLTKPADKEKPTNIVGQSSNLINTKVKPTIAPPNEKISSASTTEKLLSTVTRSPERITTFSYTSSENKNSQSNISSTQEKITYESDPSSFPPSSTQKYVITTTKGTEHPAQKVTLTMQESNPSSTTQGSKVHTLISTTYKPTTYHPQNFANVTKKPILTENNGVSSTSSLLHRPVSTTVKTTKKPTYKPALTNQNEISTPPPTVASTATTHLNTNPTKISSTISFPSTTTTQTSSTDPTTFSTEEMPLQEIPLKIYESLKDDQTVQNIVTTILSESGPTTTAKEETTVSNVEESTTGSSTTTPEEDKLMTITYLPVSSSSSTPVAPNKVYIINNSEPQVMKMNITKTNTENKLAINKPVKNSTEPTIQNNTSNKTQSNVETKPQNQTELKSSSLSHSAERNTTTTTSLPTSTETTTSTEPSIVETTTNIETTTVDKDQMIQEGISAVTSILLDEAQKQQAMKEDMLSSMEKGVEHIKVDVESSSEATSGITTVVPDTKPDEISSTMKSEVRINEEIELSENSTMDAVTTTEPMPAVTNNKTKIKEGSGKKPVSVGGEKESLGKVDNNNTLVNPTKESKLNPENDEADGKSATKNKIKPISSTTIKAATKNEPITATERIKLSEYDKPIPKPISHYKKPSSNPVYQPLESLQPPAAIELHPAPYESMGLEASIAFLGEDVRRFADLCNELAFRLWTAMTGKGQISSRSLVTSPFAVISLLAMVFLGARGPTSGQMNDVLRLDDMVTFNPHQVLQNVTDSVINSKNYGVATAAFVRELYSDKAKGKILDFYKERVQQYYQGHVEEVTFSIIGDIIRRRTNLLVKRQTLGKVPEYLRGSSLSMRPPLAAFSANIFQTDCEEGSTDGRDGEMYFVVRPSTRQRRLVPVPAVVWRSGFLAGYEPSLDATSVCLGAESIVSTLLILPGQQGQVAPGDGLARLEQRLIEASYRRGGWSRLLRSLMPRPGLELQVPRFSHRSVLNVTGALQRMGLKDLFNTRADLRGLNGLSNDLHLSDMLQVNTFSTCGEETIGARHHIETYPASPQRMGRDESDRHLTRDPEAWFGDLPLALRPRQARLPDNPRLRFDRPFLYMVRHNPSGMILHMGRFNPRLLP